MRVCARAILYRMMSQHDDLVKGQEAAERSGDRVWRLAID